MYNAQAFPWDYIGRTLKIASTPVNSNLAWREAVRIDIVGKMPTSSSMNPFLGPAAIGLMVVLAVVCTLSGIDTLAIGLFCHEGLPGDLKKLISLFEIFGHGTGVVVVALLVRVLDPDGVRRSITVLASGFLAGLAVICLKPFFIRIRPSMLEELVGGATPRESMVGFQWWGNFSSDSVDASHGFFHDALHSFPSGHTATACALAWCLSRMYPNGRFVFWGFATMVAAQRLFAQAHYLSDTIAGAMVGVLVAILINKYRVRSAGATTSG